MSKLIALRIPDALLVLIDVEAANHGMTRTAAIVNFMWGLAPPMAPRVKSKVSVHRPEELRINPNAKTLAEAIPGVLLAAEMSIEEAKKKLPPPAFIRKPARPQVSSTNCPYCGALGGMHQKFCKAGKSKVS